MNWKKPWTWFFYNLQEGCIIFSSGVTKSATAMIFLSKFSNLDRYKIGFFQLKKNHANMKLTNSENKIKIQEIEQQRARNNIIWHFLSIITWSAKIYEENTLPLLHLWAARRTRGHRFWARSTGSDTRRGSWLNLKLNKRNTLRKCLKFTDLSWRKPGYFSVVIQRSSPLWWLVF